MFIIVKYASKEYEHQWGKHKPSDGVFANLSIHETHVGKSLGIKPYYENKEDAEEDLLRAIEANSTVGYAICPVLSFWSDRVQGIVLSAFVSMRPIPPTMKVLVLVHDKHIKHVTECVISRICIDFLHNAEPPMSVISSVAFKTNGEYFNPPTKHDVFVLSIDF